MVIPSSVLIFCSICYLISLQSFVTAATVSYYCPYGWNVYRVGESCMRLMKYPTTAAGAEHNCRTYGGHLVSIRNQDEFDLIEAQILLLNSQDHLSTKNGVWIGLANRGFHLVGWTDGSPYEEHVSSSRIDKSLLYHGGCVLHKIVEGNQWTEWVKADCTDQKYPYICQKPPFRTMGGFYRPSSSTTMPKTEDGRAQLIPGTTVTNRPTSPSSSEPQTTTKPPRPATTAKYRGWTISTVRPTRLVTTPRTPYWYTRRNRTTTEYNYWDDRTTTNTSRATTYTTTTTTTVPYWHRRARTSEAYNYSGHRTSSKLTTTTTTKRPYEEAWRWQNDQDSSYVGVEEHEKKMSGNMIVFMGLVMCTGVAAVLILGMYFIWQHRLAKGKDPEAPPEIKVRYTKNTVDAVEMFS